MFCNSGFAYIEISTVSKLFKIVHNRSSRILLLKIYEVTLRNVPGFVLFVVPLLVQKKSKGMKRGAWRNVTRLT